ncbi:MAG: PAS domain-containing sensor histidine kinase [bacterium]|nr:PAS domain-containing sensor histidine kinase [bacterium]
MRSAFRRFLTEWRHPTFLPISIGGIFLAGIALGAIFFSGPVAVIATITFGVGCWLLLFITTLKLDTSRRESAIVTQELDGFIAHLRHPIVFYDPNITILRINRAAEQLFQINAAEIVGKRLEPSAARNPHLKTFTQLLFPSLAPSVVELSEAGMWPQVVVIATEDPHAEFLTTLHRVIDQGGAVVGFLKLIEDRTREQEILKSKTEFITVAAHQLRTPLTAMQWLIDNLAAAGSNSDAPELRDGLAELRALSDRTLKITNDLLDAARIEEGKFGYRFEDTDVIALIRRAIQAVHSIAKENQIRVYFSPPPEPRILRVDPTRIETALTNMLDNAIKYNTQNGTVTVLVTDEPEAGMVRVSVEDTGIGVPKDEMGALFTKLHRGSNAQEVQPNGSGLGLYIAKNIIERHGGTIGLTSTLGRGSVGWFTLPIDPARIPSGADGVMV